MATFPKAFHTVMSVGGASQCDPTWPSPAERAEAIRRDGLRPPFEWRGGPPGRDAGETSLGNYLAGLWHYVFFSFGVPYPSGNSSLPPALQLEIDTEYLVLQRGARVVKEVEDEGEGECIAADDLGPAILRELGRAPREGEYWLDAAREAWLRDPEGWTTRSWRLAHEKLIPDLTLGGKEALDFLSGLDAGGFGTYDIVLKGPLVLTEPGIRLLPHT
jgi:hypothetical protein